MKGTIFLVGTDGTLSPMQESEYVKESDLQRLLALYSDLLPGDQIDPDEPRRWLFIGREVGIPGGEDEADWLSLDHLFLDQDAIPTFIECKRSSDTRARREVVAQMLDYAANGTVYWSADRLRQKAIESAAPNTLPVDERVQSLLGDGTHLDVDGFWQKVDENLRLGRVRLIIVLDEAPRELRRLTEFLNEQMRETEVLLLEIKQFKGANSQHALVPRLIGRTEHARSRRQTSSSRTSLAEVFQALERLPHEEGRIGRDLEMWLKSLQADLWMGADGFAPKFTVAGTDYYPFKVKQDGRVVIWCASLKRQEAFADERVRLELLERLNEIPGVSITPDRAGGKPSFPLATLGNTGAMETFKGVVAWLLGVAAASSRR